jgi:hypothetical protein
MTIIFFFVRLVVNHIYRHRRPQILKPPFTVLLLNDCRVRHHLVSGFFMIDGNTLLHRSNRSSHLCSINVFVTANLLTWCYKGCWKWCHPESKQILTDKNHTFRSREHNVLMLEHKETPVAVRSAYFIFEIFCMFVLETSGLWPSFSFMVSNHSDLDYWTVTEN